MNDPLFYKIPTFAVKLDDPDVLANSVARIRQGNGCYDFNDVCVFSDWIGICAFQYMADCYQEEKQRALKPADLQDHKLYYGQCGPVCEIANDLLMKTNVTFSLCSTKRPCQRLQSHVAVLSRFEPQGGGIRILYDPSLRQYFDTDRDGVLHDRFWKNKADHHVAENLLATKQGKDTAENLLQSGFAPVEKPHCHAYLGAFVDSAKKLDEHFRASNLSVEYLWYQFVTQKRFFLHCEHRRYTLLPGDEGFDDTAAEFFTLQKRLHP